jgi:hypothetical protein
MSKKSFISSPSFFFILTLLWASLLLILWHILLSVYQFVYLPLAFCPCSPTQLSDHMIHEQAVNHTWTYPWPPGTYSRKNLGWPWLVFGHYDNVAAMQFYTRAIHQAQANYQTQRVAFL